MFHHPVKILRVFVESIVAPFILDPKEYEQGYGQASSQACNIDEGKDFVSLYVSYRDLEVVQKHGSSKN
jgi:hypothetical protein